MPSFYAWLTQYVHTSSAGIRAFVQSRQPNYSTHTNPKKSLIVERWTHLHSFCSYSRWETHSITHAHISLLNFIFHNGTTFLQTSAPTQPDNQLTIPNTLVDDRHVHQTGRPPLVRLRRGHLPHPVPRDQGQIIPRRLRLSEHTHTGRVPLIPVPYAQADEARGGPTDAAPAELGAGARRGLRASQGLWVGIHVGYGSSAMMTDCGSLQHHGSSGRQRADEGM